MGTANDMWLEFLGGDPPIHCGLCGNHGIVDTIGKVSTPNGIPCGVRAFCICPNGRVMKSQSDPDFDDKLQSEGDEDTHNCGCSMCDGTHVVVNYAGHQRPCDYCECDT